MIETTRFLLEYDFPSTSIPTHRREDLPMQSGFPLDFIPQSQSDVTPGQLLTSYRKHTPVWVPQVTGVR